MLKIKRPIVFLDIETTGTWVEKDRIVEIAMIKMLPDGKQLNFSSRVNPRMNIPKDSTRIHGIADKDVKDAPTFGELVPSILDFIDGCELAGFGIERFDLRILETELGRAGIEYNIRNHSILDIQQIYHLKQKRDLTAAYQFYCRKNLENAHSAKADVKATVEIFQAQLNHYPELNKDIDKVRELLKDYGGDYVDSTRKFRWWNNEAYFNFGGDNVRGKPLRHVAENDPRYLEWMLNSDFTPEVKNIVEDALNGIFPKK